MTACKECGKIIIQRNPRNSGINIIRWNYWNNFKKISNYIKKKKGNGGASYHKAIERTIHQEYDFKIDEVEERHRELEDVNIKNVSEEVMDFIKFSVYNYVMNKYISSVIICGAAAEYLLDDFIFITNLIEPQKKEIQEIRTQEMKLILCKYASIIDQSEYSMFEEIRKNRNYYAHPNYRIMAYSESEAEKIRNQRNKNSKERAKKSIRNLINLANKVYSKLS
ncbi:hypothetical protein HYX00_06155 [Candidatus Woesearchaeota archaeon]|nr:hypothetical protein [Candidatus Woesearchaeota archaeon]